MPDRSHRIERAYRTSLSVSRALRYARGEAELTAEICRIAVEVAGYRMAWIGYVEGDAEKTVRPVAHAGVSDGYLDHLAITWGEGDHGLGPTGLAIRTGRTQVAQHIASDPRLAPWRDDALKRGYASSAALPLRDGELTFGTLNLYAPEPHAFDAEEVELLEHVAEDLAHGVLCTRGRVTLSALQRAMERMACASSLEHMAAAVAHDVNNYLTVVLPCLQQLGRKVSEADQRLVADALAALDRAVALNRRLLELAARAPVAPTLFAPDAALAALEPALRGAAGAGVALELTLGAGEARVRMDPIAFEQVVVNLVVNARDAMPAGGTVALGTTPVEVRSPLPASHLGLKPGRYLSLRVVDSGHGMAPEVLERAFDPFFSTKGAQGTGLGLATARGFVHQAGGRVSVTSSPGAGTTFEVLLPRAD
ncbi:MAG: GAF domain-containing protein [Myxococcales bacterium]|nr:GAF domain-containing protein [Myxococcales bacterium]